MFTNGNSSTNASARSGRLSFSVNARTISPPPGEKPQPEQWESDGRRPRIDFPVLIIAWRHEGEKKGNA